MSGAITHSRRVEVEHIKMECERSFDDVRRKLEANTPPVDATVLEALHAGNTKRVERERREGPKLSLFLTRDHGGLLSIYGRPRKAYQYEIGNAITAASMTRYRLSAALYAPLRVTLYEDEQGRGVFEYDRPSSLFGQFGDDRVTEVGRALDASLQEILDRAAG